MEVLSLYIYPIKSLPAIKINHSVVDKDGLQFDRIFALYDAQGIMQTRRICKGLADYLLELKGNTLMIYSKVLEKSINIKCYGEGHESIPLNVWDRVEEGFADKESINQFFSDHHGKKLHLYLIKKSFSGFSSFHDDSPILICNETSIAYLESKTDVKIDIMRFRPNIVVSSKNPFDEGIWKRLRINGCEYNSVKLCSRCIVVNQDPSTSKTDLNVLQLMEPYTKSSFKIKFGLYLNPLSESIVRLFDKIDVVE
ncbi:MAG: MOSC N-terminal beta barrel domain-containing protein [Saprospiraceae bacterium]